MEILLYDTMEDTMTALSIEAKNLINDIHPGLIASASTTGQPNVSIAGSFRVLDDEHLAFADIHSPRTTANLEANRQAAGSPVGVCAIVFDPATRHGCRVWGTAEVLSSGEILDKMNEALAARNMHAKHVVVIGVNEFVTF
jgi:uncharacterized protein